ncbi:MAG: hypothetical protein FJY73_10475 [Candidatus Eisenbacteria bacterium]|nr:hypothetical protein [Candidatus Eisenbacteria bacterium]
MKECEWCGDDFRGEGVRLANHFFCCEECREEFRKDVYGDAEPEDLEADEPGPEKEE